MNTPGRRAAVLLLAGVLPLGLLAVAVAVPALEWDRLPARVADHWGLAGHPNGSDPKAVAFAVAVGLAIIGAGLAAVGGRLAGGPAGARLLAVGLILAGVGAALSVYLTVVNLGVSRWQETRQPVPAIVALVAGPLALGGAAMALARRLGLGAAAGPERPPDRLGLRGSERAFWLSRASNNWALPLAAAGLVAGATVGAVARWEPAMVIVVLSVPGLLFGSVSVGVSAAGVVVRYGPLRWPHTRIALERILSAEAVDLAPTGWGYRGSLRLLGSAAVIIRRGSALSLRLTGGKSFVVTVDDAATGAALLNEEIARSSP